MAETRQPREAAIHDPSEHGREMANRSGFMLAQGILLILLGIAIVIWPVASLAAILFLIAIYGILSGIVEIIWGMFHLGRGATLPIVVGVVSLIVGLFIVRAPEISILTLFYLLGGWFIVTGFYSFTRVSSASSGMRALNILGGILSIIVGVLLFVSPLMSGIALYWVLGVYALIAGAVLIGKSILARRHMHEDKQREQQRFHPAT